MAKQPFVPVPQVGRFRYIGTINQSPFVNGFHFIYVGAQPSATALNTLATSLGAVWSGHISGAISNRISQTGVQVWDIASDTGNQGTDSTVHNGQLVDANALPVSTCAVVSWPVNQRWRGGHFRTYQPFQLGTSVQNGRLLASGEPAIIQSAWLAWLNAANQLQINSQNITICGVRYFPVGVTNVKTSGVPLAFQPPVVHQRLDSQRRRLGKEVP